MANQPQGTGFTNISSFLNANQGNQLGDAAAQNVSGQVSNIGGNLSNLYGNFQQQASVNALGTPEQQQAASGALSQIMGGNTNVDSGQASQFQKYLGGQYGGPTGLDQSKTAQLSSQAGNLNSLLSGPNGVSTTGGRQNLLRNIINNPNYSQGQQVLDATLLGQNQGALNQAKQSAAGLGQAIQQKQNAANAIGQQNVAAAKDFAGQVGQQLTGTAGQLDQNVQNQLAQEQAQQGQGFNQAYGNYNGLIGTNANTAQQLGLTQDQLGQIGLQGISDLTPYLSNANLSAGNVITPQQIAQFQALSQLSGRNTTDLTQTPLTGSNLQPGQLFNLDTAGVQQQAQANLPGLQQQGQQIQQQIQQLQQPRISGDFSSAPAYGKDYSAALNNQLQNQAQTGSFFRSGDQSQAAASNLAAQQQYNTFLYGAQPNGNDGALKNISVGGTDINGKPVKTYFANFDPSAMDKIAKAGNNLQQQQQVIQGLVNQYSQYANPNTPAGQTYQAFSAGLQNVLDHLNQVMASSNMQSGSVGTPAGGQQQSPF